MGVKDLWSILTPHADRKPIAELRGKVVAIDLAGWVCESLNVVDYFVHPRQHLKNLFFRTCYLIWEDVTPVFVLEGAAPKLKSKVIEKRNEIQFRGVRPKEKDGTQKSGKAATSQQQPKGDKGRTRFNHVLKQCENLLNSMGITCVQGPGEAEAYCAFMNQKDLVHGVISQDSDCFAYGALRVYRNFSVSTQGALAAQGGAVDIYDMHQICSKMDFGQNKVIVMALLCGCDYCPDGIGGIGRDSVLKLFTKYSNDEILNRLRSWRLEDSKYSAMEMRVDDKLICSYCGHMGRTQSHTKNGCGICRTTRGCDESLWKEERLAIKSEIGLRKKALVDPTFPSEEIIEEFLRQPKEIPKLTLQWQQPNIVKFVKQIGILLQWTEVYCFQKMFPLLTRWQILNVARLKDLSNTITYIAPKEIIKKRVVKGIPSLELLWKDEQGFFKGLIPDEQLKEYETDNPKAIQELWTTIEPFSALESAYPALVEDFLKSKEKPKKTSKKANKLKKTDIPALSSLENLTGLLDAANDIAKTIKPKRQNKVKKTKQGLQMIDRYFKQKTDEVNKENNFESPARITNKLFSCVTTQSSTPFTKSIPSDLDSDLEDDIDFNMSDIVNGIVGNSLENHILKSHMGKKLRYERIPQNISMLLKDMNGSNTVAAHESLDDLDVLLVEEESRRAAVNLNIKHSQKRMSLDDSFDILVKKGSSKLTKYETLQKCSGSKFEHLEKPNSVVDRFKQRQGISLNFNDDNSRILNSDQKDNDKNVSHFFNNSVCNEMDVFEKLMETSFAKNQNEEEVAENDEDY